MTSDIGPFSYFICGGFSGICTVLVGHPFDTIKVRLQTCTSGQNAVYKGTLDCVKQTLKNEGVRGFYKGMGAPLVSVAPTFAMSFMGYGIGKRVFGPENGEKLKYSQEFCAGAFSGIFFSALMIPSDRVKCLLQIQKGASSKQYKGPLDCALKLFALGGIASLYKGTDATLLREIPASGVFFLTYNYVKEFLGPNGADFNVWKTVLSGGIAGIAYWVVAMPPDVLKSRLQVSEKAAYPNGVFDVFRELIKNEGARALYKGVVPVFLRAFPANATCFLSFEVCKEFILFLSGNKNEL